MTNVAYALALIVSTCTLARAQTGPTGTWREEALDWTVVLRVDGPGLTGTVSSGGSRPIEIYEGKIDGNTITFKCKSADGDRTITFTGKVNGDEIEFTREVQVRDGGSRGGGGIFGASARPRFTAKRVAEATVSPQGTRTTLQAEQRDPPVTTDDLRILVRADDLLKDESVWNRKDDRVCDDDESTGKRSLFCALQKACVEVLGSYDHRRAALQEVRFALGDATADREFAHRLMDFNNLAETRLTDVKKVLAVAKVRVKSRLERRPE